MKHLIFDTETTDLIKNTARRLDKQPRIIEFFSISWDDETNEEIETHILVNPGIAIPEIVIGITGITNEMIKDKPPFQLVASSIVNLINANDRPVAHNLSYDQSVIDFELKRLGGKIDWKYGVCTVEATEHFKGHRLTLSALHEYLFGVAFTGAHRAEIDVRALFRCYRKLIEDGVIG